MMSFCKRPKSTGRQNHAEPSNTREKYYKPMENPIIDHKITIFIGGNYHPQMVCTQIQVEAAMKSEVQPGLTHGFTAQS